MLALIAYTVHFVSYLQQLSRLLVLFLLVHGLKLIDGSHEHLKTLQRSDRQRQVALGTVQGFDVLRDILNHAL